MYRHLSIAALDLETRDRRFYYSVYLLYEYKSTNNDT
jgi:hypothetical protein